MKQTMKSLKSARAARTAKTERIYQVPVWWGWAAQHGWVVLDRTLAVGPYLYFVRVKDWRLFRESPDSWHRPRYTYAPNYLNEVGPAARHSLERYQRQFSALRPQLPRLVSYIERLDELQPAVRRITGQLEAHKRRYFHQFGARAVDEDEIGVRLDRLDRDLADWHGQAAQILGQDVPPLNVKDADLARMEEGLEQLFEEAERLADGINALGLVIRRAIARPLTVALHRRFLRRCRLIPPGDEARYEAVSWRQRHGPKICAKCHCELDSKHDLECTLCTGIICGCGACRCLPLPSAG